MSSLFRPETSQYPETPEPLELAWHFCREPQKAMRRLLDYDCKFFHWQLLGIFCAATVLPLLLTFALVGDFVATSLNMDSGSIMLIIGPGLMVMLLASLYGFAALLWLTAKPLGGEASFSEVLAATLWPLVPMIPASLLGLIPLLGELTGLVALIWAGALMVSTVAETQGFDKRTSLVNQTIAALFVVVVASILLYKPMVALIQQLQALTGSTGF